MTGLGKEVLCSRKLSVVGKTVAADSEDQARGGGDQWLFEKKSF